MDSTSDSDNEEISEFCKKLKIKVPLKKKEKKQKQRNVSLSELENIDINNLPIQILPELTPVCNDERTLVINQELSQESVVLATETEV